LTGVSPSLGLLPTEYSTKKEERQMHMHATSGIRTRGSMFERYMVRVHKSVKTLLLIEENRRLKRNWPIDLIWGTGDSPLDDSPSRHCNNHNISLQNVNSEC
jgi:hypothetical protein